MKGSLGFKLSPGFGALIAISRWVASPVVTVVDDTPKQSGESGWGGEVNSKEFIALDDNEFGEF